ERAIAELLPQPIPIHADRLAPRQAARAADRQDRHDRLAQRRDAVAKNAQRKQWKPHQLEQDREQEVEETDQQREKSLQELDQGQRGRNQRQNDEVFDAKAEMLRRGGRSGVLMGAALIHGLAILAGRIRKGEKPADLPVQQEATLARRDLP